MDKQDTVYIQIMKFHPAIKGKGIQLQHGWTLKTILAERSQSQKTMCITGFHLYEMSRTGNSTELRKYDCLGLGCWDKGEWLPMSWNFLGEW